MNSRSYKIQNMILGSISEDKNQESRVALTPEIIKKYIFHNALKV